MTWGRDLQADYPTKNDLRRDLPGLILRHNLHGIDIDLRCTQIAALALWLRCQRAYQEMGLKKDRPAILKANVVCAEPMPGEKELLDEFLKTLRDDHLETLIRQVMQVPDGTRVRATKAMADSLADLVRSVWDKMRLAGEAGSLLKIEEELQDAIRKGQDEWEERLPLFRFTEYGLSEVSKERLVRFVPGDVEGETLTFWDKAEALVRQALDEFVEYASNGGRFQRRLFVEDARQGLGFVDIYRMRYDVVLMNPPFGSATGRPSELLNKQFPQSAKNLFAMFVIRASELMESGGLVGALTPRTFLTLASFKNYRGFILSTFSIGPLANLGWEVLDEAQVEVCAFVTGLMSTSGYSPFFEVASAQPNQRAQDLRQQITNPSKYRPFVVSTGSFEKTPNESFSYRLPMKVFHTYLQGNVASKDFYDVFEGAAITGADQFHRLWWEVSARSLQKTWFPLAHGGEFAPYFRSIVTVIDWEDDGKRPKQVITSRYPYLMGNYGLKIKHEDLYFQKGLAYGKRTDSLNVSIMPAGCVFSHEAQAVFLKHENRWRECLAFLNSAPVRYCANQICEGHKLAGYISRLPCSEAVVSDLVQFSTDVELLVKHRHNLAKGDETSRDFCVPLLISGPTLIACALAGMTQRLTAELKLTTIERSIADAIDQHFDTAELRGLPVLSELEGDESDEERDISDVTLRDDYLISACESDTLSALSSGELVIENDATLTADLIDSVSRLVSYTIGVIYGRWNIQIALGTILAVERENVFDPFLNCSPGMLQDDTGFPAQETYRSVYPIAVNWDGILVDDPDQSDDIIRRVCDVFEVIWKDRADAIEKEACEILGVAELRDYFRKPGAGGFWDDHVKRYSKSRRKAPIYWLLQSSKKNYALWIYYHRLDKDILFKALLNYVEPKIRREEARLGELRSQKTALGSAAKGTKKLDKDIERQDAFLSELRDFEDKLCRAANLHLDPDLNDGVVLNIAPLRELVPWKEAKSYWDDLMDGKYEWSSIAKQLRVKGLVK